MNEKLVLDTGVLSLLFAGHASVKLYFDAIASGRSVGLVSAINLAEFYYRTCQTLGKETADTRYFQVMFGELDVVHKEELVRAAGLEKCRQSRLSLADRFAVALAKSERATLVTTESELAKVEGIETRHVRV